MMFTRTAQRLARFTALLAALVCLWCSTGGALHHTDDFRAGLSFAAGQNSFGHAHQVSVPDACAAHEWEQTVPTLCASLAPVSLSTFPLARLNAFLPQTLHTLLPGHAAPRGPPASALCA